MNKDPIKNGRYAMACILVICPTVTIIGLYVA
jgi:hypothetical protein